MARSEIWLIRHGQTEWSRTGQHTGRQDLPLTAQGEAEARAAAGILAGRKFELVLCSPLQRAKRTCEIAGYLDQALIEPDIMEWDYGALSGRTVAQVREEMPGWNIWEGPVPGGESLDHIAERARRVLKGLAAIEGDVAIFAHGHFLRIFTTQYLGLPAAAAKHFALSTSAVSILGRDAGSPAIVRWNYRSSSLRA